MTSVGTMSAKSFLVNTIVVQMKRDVLSNCQFLQPPPLVQQFLNEATIDSVLLAALELFEDQATDRVATTLCYWMNMKTEAQNKRRRISVKKTLPSTLTKHCMQRCTICIFVVNDHNKKMKN